MIRAIQKGVEEKLVPQYARGLSLTPGFEEHGKSLFKLALPQEITSEINISELSLFAKDAIKTVFRFLKNHCEIFSAGEITFIAPEAGIRTGPRNTGKYVLTGKDVLNAGKFADSVARGAWPVEYWEPGKKVRMEYFGMDDHYDIPAGTLQSGQIGNLFFCGRNIPADDTAIASARVIGTCLATGYASGVLAAFHSRSKKISGAISEIQSELFADTVHS
jgi:hypothetical protein